MATAKQTQRRRPEPMVSAHDRKPPASQRKTLRELYARLEKTQPGPEESKRISAQIVAAIG